MIKKGFRIAMQCGADFNKMKNKSKINRENQWMVGKCRECNRPISFCATHCSSCAKKGSRSNRWNGGISLKKNVCVDCDKKISKSKAKRCHPCNAKWLHKQDKIFTPEAKEKMREAKLGRGGKSANNWQGGLSNWKYPLGWNKIHKELIRNRDNYKCQICGCHEVENGRRLDVHHIDYDKNNIHPENLVSLCHHCHMKTNGNRRFWIEFFDFSDKLRGEKYGN